MRLLCVNRDMKGYYVNDAADLHFHIRLIYLKILYAAY